MNLPSAVGDSVDLLIEGHGRFNIPTSIKIAKELEQFKPMFFEEPVYDDGYIEDMPEEQGGFPLWAKILLIVGGIVVGIAVVIVVVVIIVKTKKANDALLLEDDEDY